MATGGKAKVWGLAFKDRAAILMAGHLADGVLWFDDETASWISSRFYFKDGHLPGWVTEWNAAKKIDPFFGKTWNLSVPAAALDRLWKPGNEFANPRAGLGKSFPHPITGGLDKPGKAFYSAFESTPYGNQYVLESAAELVRREKLGADSVPGSAGDQPVDQRLHRPLLRPRQRRGAGRRRRDGPSPKRLLPLPGAHRPRRSRERHHRADGRPRCGADGRGEKREGFATALAYQDPALGAAAKAALEAAFGAGDWSQGLVEYNFYLNLEALKAKGIEPAKAEAVAAEAFRRQPGIYAAYTRGQIVEGRMPPTDIARRIVLGFHPAVSGDVVIVLDPYTVPNYGKGTVSLGTTHGTPYAYDTSVPLLLAGAGIKPGRYTARVSTLDIAPTLSDLLGILQPSGCEGHVLSQSLR